MTQRYAKVGLFGGGGSGKTLTAILAAIGLSKTYHGNAPIAFFDTEDQSDFVQPICELEDVRLVVTKSRSFIDMRDAHRQAQVDRCCAFICDSYSHPAKELETSLKEKLDYVGRRLPFHHREQIFSVWDEWVREMRTSPLHCFLNGRLAWEWDEADDDNGDARLMKVGTKMRGDADAGYEPDLLIEMDAVRDSLRRDKTTKTKRGNMKHAAIVLKDRWMVLNGKTFVWNDLNDYKAGDYQEVFKALRPHFDRFTATAGNAGQQVGTRVARSSAELFAAPSGENKFAERARRVTIALEEIHGLLNHIWSGRSEDNKRLRDVVLFTLFKSRSMTYLETLMPETLESALLALRQFAAQIKEPMNEAKVVDLIQSCKDELLANTVL